MYTSTMLSYVCTSILSEPFTLIVLKIFNQLLLFFHLPKLIQIIDGIKWTALCERKLLNQYQW